MCTCLTWHFSCKLCFMETMLLSYKQSSRTTESLSHALRPLKQTTTTFQVKLSLDPEMCFYDLKAEKSSKLEKNTNPKTSKPPKASRVSVLFTSHLLLISHMCGARLWQAARLMQYIPAEGPLIKPLYNSVTKETNKSGRGWNTFSLAVPAKVWCTHPCTHCFFLVCTAGYTTLWREVKIACGKQVTLCCSQPSCLEITGNIVRNISLEIPAQYTMKIVTNALQRHLLSPLIIFIQCRKSSWEAGATKCLALSL